MARTKTTQLAFNTDETDLEWLDVTNHIVPILHTLMRQVSQADDTKDLSACCDTAKAAIDSPLLTEMTKTQTFYRVLNDVTTELRAIKEKLSQFEQAELRRQQDATSTSATADLLRLLSGVRLGGAGAGAAAPSTTAAVPNRAQERATNYDAIYKTLDADPRCQPCIAESNHSALRVLLSPDSPQLQPKSGKTREQQWQDAKSKPLVVSPTERLPTDSIMVLDHTTGQKVPLMLFVQNNLLSKVWGLDHAAVSVSPSAAPHNSNQDSFSIGWQQPTADHGQHSAVLLVPFEPIRTRDGTLLLKTTLPPRRDNPALKFDNMLYAVDIPPKKALGNLSRLIQAWNPSPAAAASAGDDNNAAVLRHGGGPGSRR